jgi:hypothetical protein
MRMNQLLIASALVIAATPALAGHSPAGPVGGPAAVGGTIVPNAKRPIAPPKMPPGLRALMQKMKGGTRWAPGRAGFVTLPAAQAAEMAAKINASDGVVTEGSVIAAPTTLAGNLPATIILDTESGRFAILRDDMVSGAPSSQPGTGPQAVPQEQPAAPQSSALTPDESTAPAVKR